MPWKSSATPVAKQHAADWLLAGASWLAFLALVCLGGHA